MWHGKEQSSSVWVFASMAATITPPHPEQSPHPECQGWVPRNPGPGSRQGLSPWRRAAERGVGRCFSSWSLSQPPHQHHRLPARTRERDREVPTGRRLPWLRGRTRPPAAAGSSGGDGTQGQPGAVRGAENGHGLSRWTTAHASAEQKPPVSPRAIAECQGRANKRLRGLPRPAAYTSPFYNRSVRFHA